MEPAGGTAPAASTAVARRHGDLDVLRYEAPISFTDRIRDYLRDAGRRVVRGRRLSLTRDRGLSLSVGLLEPFDETGHHDERRADHVQEVRFSLGHPPARLRTGASEGWVDVRGISDIYRLPSPNRIVAVILINQANIHTP